MEHFQKMPSREESDAVASRIDAEFEDCGFSFWPLRSPGFPVHRLCGFASGAVHSPLRLPLRSAGALPEHWGHGYVTERQRGRSFRLEDVGLDEVVLSPRQTM